jgi:uncharacterized protein (TIGR02145 family)
MKKFDFLQGLLFTVVLLVSFLVMPVCLNAQAKGSYTDSRDGYAYRWVKIGSQTWMAENLRFNAPAGSWIYNNDSANLATFGRLYTWKAAQTACPKGYHLPTDKEWETLIQFLGGTGESGMKMQAMDTIGKGPGIAGSAAPGAMSSLLGGVRHADGSCIGINIWGGCWSAGKVNDTIANNVLFAHGTKDMDFSTNDKKSGFSVRCVRVK